MRTADFYRDRSPLANRIAGVTPTSDFDAKTDQIKADVANAEDGPLLQLGTNRIVAREGSQSPNRRVL